MRLGGALRALVASGTPCIVVVVEKAEGSTPREAGASMLVTRDGALGTIGGGALEMEAIVEARRMLLAGETGGQLDIPLGPAIGQCCGGRVALSLRLMDAATLADVEQAEAASFRARPPVWLFGAGHTGLALAHALAPLPFAVTVVETRAPLLAGLPEGTHGVATPLPEAAVAKAPAGSAFVIMTHDHALDFMIAAAALRRGDAAYVGMIGSATKREKLRRYLAGDGQPSAIDHLVSPVGGSRVRDKRPEVIAALTAAELINHLLKRPLAKPCPEFAHAQRGCNKKQRETTPERGITGKTPHAATS